MPEDKPAAHEHGWLIGLEAYLALMGQNDAPRAIALADRALAIGREVGSVEFLADGTIRAYSEDYIDDALATRMVANLRRL